MGIENALAGIARGWGQYLTDQANVSKERQRRKAMVESILEEEQAKYDAQQKRRPEEMKQKIADMKQEASVRFDINHQEKEKTAQEAMKHILSVYPEIKNDPKKLAEATARAYGFAYAMPEQQVSQKVQDLVHQGKYDEAMMSAKDDHERKAVQDVQHAQSLMGDQFLFDSSSGLMINKKTGKPLEVPGYMERMRQIMGMKQEYRGGGSGGGRVDPYEKVVRVRNGKSYNVYGDEIETDIGEEVSYDQLNKVLNKYAKMQADGIPLTPGEQKSYEKTRKQMLELESGGSTPKYQNDSERNAGGSSGTKTSAAPKKSMLSYATDILFGGNGSSKPAPATLGKKSQQFRDGLKPSTEESPITNTGINTGISVPSGADKAVNMRENEGPGSASYAAGRLADLLAQPFENGANQVKKIGSKAIEYGQGTVDALIKSIGKSRLPKNRGFGGD